MIPLIPGNERSSHVSHPLRVELTFVLLLLLGNFSQLLRQFADDLLFLQLLPGENGVEISLWKANVGRYKDLEFWFWL